MSYADKVYKELVERIIHEGELESGDVRPKYIDGTPAYTKRVYNANFTFKPEDGIPLLQSKRVAIKSFKAEIDWIWRLMSNDVNLLNELGSKVWDSWKLADGTIGPAYGAALKNKTRKMMVRADWKNPNASGIFGEQDLNQVEYILHEIIHNPKSRRILTTLYNIEDLSDMALEPCVFLTNWQVGEDGRLHLFVTQRSADVALGLPSNWYEYSLLHHRIAQVTGREVGNMHWNIFNAHIYDRHLDLLEEQVNQDLSEVEESRARFILPEDKDYFNVSLKEVEVADYKYSKEKFKYEIAV